MSTLKQNSIKLNKGACTLSWSNVDILKYWLVSIKSGLSTDYLVINMFYVCIESHKTIFIALMPHWLISFNTNCIELYWLLCNDYSLNNYFVQLVNIYSMNTRFSNEFSKTMENDNNHNNNGVW